MEKDFNESDFQNSSISRDYENEQVRSFLRFSIGAF